MTAERTSWTARACLLLVVALPLFSYPLSWLPASTASRALTLPLAVVAGIAILLGLAIRLVSGRSGVPAATGPTEEPQESRRGRRSYLATMPVSIPRPLIAPMLIWAISLLISVRFSQHPHLSVLVLPLFLSNLCLLWLGTCLPPAQLPGLAWCWLGTATIVAVNGLIRLGSDGAMLSTIGNQNVTAAYLASSVPLAVALRNRWSYLLGGGLLVTLLFCRSRGAWLALAILALAAFIVAGSRRRWLAAAPAVALIVWLGVTQWNQDVRPIIWRGTLKMIAAHPLAGHGLGTFLVNYPPFRPPEYFARPKAAPVTDHAHNELLEVTAEQGVIGLAATLWLWGCALRRRGQMPVAGGLAGSALILAVHGLLDVGLRFPPAQSLFWLVLGVVAAHGPPVEFAALRLGSRFARFSLAVVCVAVAAWMFVAGVLNPVRADWWEQRAHVAERGNDQTAAIAAARRALQAQPFRPHTRFFLARLLADASPDAAIAELERLQELAPDYANTRYNLGLLYLRQGRTAEAIPHLRRAVEMNPGDQDARRLLDELASPPEHR